jgi:hypothetical protein
MDCIAVATGKILLRRHLGWLVAYLLVLVTGLIAICYWKGEKPRWRWGKD